MQLFWSVPRWGSEAKLHYEITLLASWVFKLSFKLSSRVMRPVMFGTLDSIFFSVLYWDYIRCERLNLL